MKVLGLGMHLGMLLVLDRLHQLNDPPLPG